MNQPKKDKLKRKAKTRDEQLLTVGKHRMQSMMSNMVPQIALTLVSVVQGVILATLVNVLPSAWENGYQSIAYSFASFLIIVAFWHAFVSAAIMLKWTWPIRALDTLLYFTIALVENINVTLVNKPVGWLVSTSILCFLFSLISWRNLKSVMSSHYDQEFISVKNKVANHHRYGIVGFVVLGLLNLGLSIITNRYSTTWIAVIALLPSLVASVAAMISTEKVNRQQLILAGLSAELE